jgi:hypothetical protein
MQKEEVSKTELSRESWQRLAEQSGLDMTQLDQEAVYQACLRLRALLQRLDKLAGSEAETAAIFLPERF